MPRLDGEILLITGGTQGLGEVTALLAAESGAAGIVICGRQQDKGKNVETAIEDRGCPALYVPAGLSREEDCRQVVRACDERFGRVDGLVNSAADTSRGNLQGTTIDVARLSVYLLSEDSGIMTGSLVDFAQRVTSYVPPVPVDW